MDDRREADRTAEGTDAGAAPEGAGHPEAVQPDSGEVRDLGRASEVPLSELDELRGELDAAQERHLRLAAEFDNFRRRSFVQLGDAEARAQARLIGKLLDALDDLGRVTGVDPEAATVELVLEGVALVERKLFQLLRDAGLEEVNPVGEPFDPNIMEAIVRVPADSESQDDTVADVYQRGFVLSGHLIRPARVSVRKSE